MLELVKIGFCVWYVLHQDGGSSDGRDGGEEARGENLTDITGAPGYDYLAPAERVLCSQLQMTPGSLPRHQGGCFIGCVLFFRLLLLLIRDLIVHGMHALCQQKYMNRHLFFSSHGVLLQDAVVLAHPAAAREGQFSPCP